MNIPQYCPIQPQQLQQVPQFAPMRPPASVFSPFSVWLLTLAGKHGQQVLPDTIQTLEGNLFNETNFLLLDKESLSEMQIPIGARLSLLKIIENETAPKKIQAPVAPNNNQHHSVQVTNQQTKEQQRKKKQENKKLQQQLKQKKQEKEKQKQKQQEKEKQKQKQKQQEKDKQKHQQKQQQNQLMQQRESGRRREREDDNVNHNINDNRSQRDHTHIPRGGPRLTDDDPLIVAAARMNSHNNARN